MSRRPYVVCCLLSCLVGENFHPSDNVPRESSQINCCPGIQHVLW